MSGRDIKPLLAKSMIERASVAGVLGNLALVAFKLFAGIVGRSSAMTSDAAHSLSDALATLVAYFGATAAKAPEDVKHPYGHEQFENLAAIAIGLTLLATGGFLCYDGCVQIRERAATSADGASFATPSALPLIAAIVSIVAKELMFWFTLYYANKLDSDAFRADAWHHRTDAISSVGALIGIVGARMGYPLMDPIASVAISGFILWIAFKILRGAALKTIDTSRGEVFETEVRDCILDNPNVEHVDLVRSRMFGSRVYVEAEIAVDGNKTLYVAHRVAHEVHNAIEARFPCVKHAMIHVNPSQLDDTDADVSQSGSESGEIYRA